MRVPSCFGSQVLVVVRKLRDPSLENRNGIAFFIALHVAQQSNKKRAEEVLRAKQDQQVSLVASLLVLHPMLTL